MAKRSALMTVRIVSLRPTLYALAFVAGLGAATALAQDAEPKLDVIYVPTPQEVVDRMLEMAQVKAGDYMIDFGCGDGRMVVTAAKRGARGYGVDINPQRIKEANENAQKAGVTDKVQFKIANLFEEDLSKADVMAMYLLTDINLRLRPKILNDMKPGTRIVSHAFDMGDWEPDQKDTVSGKNVFFWIVPAKVEGKWQVENGEQKLTLNVSQKYQKLSGKAEVDGKTVDITNGQLKGAEISFTVNNQAYRGTVNGNNIEAIGGNWKARKV
jgi:precorrin-6B methylase 2